MVALLLLACAPHAPPPSFPLTGDLAQVAFLAGRWSGAADGSVTTEVWSAPRGGVMLGHGHTVDATGSTVFFEHLAVLSTRAGVVYRAWPAGVSPTDFGLAAAGPGWVEFTNPANDYPRRIRYERVGSELRATIDDGAGGNAQSWVFAGG